MLRQFGMVTLVDLTVSLTGVLVVLPAVLVLVDRGRRDGDPAPVGAATPVASPRQSVPAA